MIRPVAVMIGVLALGACGSISNGPREPTLGNAVLQSLRGLTGPKQVPQNAAALRPQITPDVLAQLQGAVLLTELGGAGAVMVEDGRNGAMVSYVDSGRVGLSLVDGIVVGTRGMGNDLMTADVTATRQALRSGGQATRVHRRLDGENAIVVTTFDCQLTRAGSVATETCSGPSATFTNTYTLDRDGAVIASRQWVGPENGMISIEQIR